MATTPRRLTAEQVRTITFRPPRFGRRGYDEDEVDAYLEAVAAALEDPAGRTLTVDQLHSVAFSTPRVGRRGYNKDEVDVFREMIEETLNDQIS